MCVAPALAGMSQLQQCSIPPEGGTTYVDGKQSQRCLGLKPAVDFNGCVQLLESRIQRAFVLQQFSNVRSVEPLLAYCQRNALLNRYSGLHDAEEDLFDRRNH